MTIYRKTDEALGAHVGDSVVVLHSESLKYFELKDVAARIWELLDEGPSSLTSVVDVLLEEFEVSRAQCEEAVAAFLSDAQNKGLVSSG